jgi:Ca-activated chloride channel homolog
MPQSTADKLREMNISEEKALMILEAMRNAEQQYLQQMKRKPTKKADPNLPDW